MVCTEIQEVISHPGSGEDRSPGLHVSEIIKDLMVEAKISPFDKPSGLTQEQLENCGEVGFMWEDLLTGIFGDRSGERPGEVWRDGIAGSPDGLFLDSDGVYAEPGTLILKEYKATWKTIHNGHPQYNFKYMMQIKAYCAMLGLTNCIMRILYINGTGRPPFPEIRSYHFVFTESEVETAWNTLVDHAIRKGMYEKYGLQPPERI